MEPQTLIFGLFLLGLHVAVSSTDQKSSLTFVIDDTGSMQIDIHEVNKTAKSIFDNVNSNFSHIDDFIVVTFNDPEIKVRNNAHNRYDFEDALSNIEPRGGGDCAEMSMSGIKLGLEHSRPGSLLWVFTDASAADMEKYYKVEDLSQKAGSQVYVAITGLCDNRTDPDFLVYRELAIATNGQVFHLRKTHIGELFKYIEHLILDRKEIITSKTFAAAGRNTIEVTVDYDMDELIIAVSGENPMVTLTNSSGVLRTTEITRLGEIAVVIADVDPGVYKVKVVSTSQTHVVVSASTDVHFQHGFSIFTPANIKGTTRKPVPGEQSHLSIKLVTEDPEGLELRSVQILDMDDNVLLEEPLKLVNNATHFYRTEKITPPEQMFKIAVKMYDTLRKTNLTRHGWTPIRPQNKTSDDAAPKAPVVTIEEGPSINAAFYRPLQLRCKIKAYPTPSVIWTSSDESANLTYDKKVPIYELPDDYISVLDITEVKINSTYTCIATNSEGRHEATVSVQTQVIIDFNVLESPENSTIEYLKPARIGCKVQAFPAASVSWTKNGNVLNPDGNIEVSKDGFILTIRSMQPYMADDYNCSVENAVVKKVFPFKLSIGGQVPPTIDKTKPNITAMERSRKDLKCLVTAGIPKPDISWSYKDVDNSSEYTSLNITTDTIHFDSVNVTDAGIYFCLAQNMAGSDSHIIRLNVVGKCEQPMKVGPCRTSLARWYYDTNIKECRKFAYGGCQNNENNFITEEDCRAECVVSTPPAIVTTLAPLGKCEQPKKVGPCRASLSRWYYDTNINECRKFTYGGCQNNENNFITEEDCRAECVVSTPPAIVTTPAPLGKCEQPKKVGPCRASLSRWYYDTNINECRKFTYGGCQNNENNFITEEDCRAECVVSTPPAIVTTPAPLEKCEQPKKVGPCRASLSRWYYDTNINECRKFTYGGCQNNENNFITEEDCRAECVVSTPPAIVTTPAPLGKCEQPKKVGPCRASLSRWYYDTNINECRKFTYGGCQNNENNFITEEDCRAECVVSTPPAIVTTPAPLGKCDQPMDAGPCQAALSKWFFDSGLKKCRQFYYGGCHGNQNRFDLEEECYAECDPTALDPVTPSQPLACFLDVKQDLNGNDPLMLTKNDEFTNFEISDGYLQIPLNETIKLVCPVKFKKVLFKEVIVTCDSEKQFLLQPSGSPYAYSDLKCTEEWQYKNLKTGRQCSNTDSELLNVGFEIRGRFQEVYQVCLNRITNNPIYTKHNLIQSLPNAVSNEDTAWFDNEESIDLDVTYDCDLQNKEISRILNKEFHEDSCCFARRMLVNPLDVAAGKPQAATYSYLNTAPHWSNCNFQNWKEIEQRIRDLRRTLGRPLLVWTGVAQHLHLPDASSELKNLTLSHSGKEFQVPKYFWKVVQDSGSKASLAIIQVNVPDLELKNAHKYVLCPDVCKKTKWMYSGHWRVPARGYTYCCSLDKFKSAFQLAYYGVLPTSRELLLGVTNLPNHVV